MIRLKTTEDILKLKEGGAILARIMRTLVKTVKPGIKASTLDELAYQLIKQFGGEPSFLNYQPDFSNRPFPNSLCVSVNDVIVHGIPSKYLVLKDGDLVSLDLGMKYKGLFTDMAVTVSLGRIKPLERKLMNTTQGALSEAIKAARYHHHLGDIGYAIENYVHKNGLVVIKDLVGHGVGYEVHEDPPVFNYGKKGEGIELLDGLVIAIEPMVTFSTSSIKENSDGSFSTLDGKKAAHFEHTIAILKNKTIILTK